MSVFFFQKSNKVPVNPGNFFFDKVNQRPQTKINKRDWQKAAENGKKQSGKNRQMKFRQGQRDGRAQFGHWHGGN
jgi:hypothetical protein